LAIRVTAAPVAVTDDGVVVLVVVVMSGAVVVIPPTAPGPTVVAVDPWPRLLRLTMGLPAPAAEADDDVFFPLKPIIMPMIAATSAVTVICHVAQLRRSWMPRLPGCTGVDEDPSAEV
jgi:hypothetical protein